MLAKKTEVNLITSVKRDESYEPFTRDFYPDEDSVKPEEIVLWEKEHEIEVHNLVTTKSSMDLKTPYPCLDFKEMGFPTKLQTIIQKHSFTTPTPIQVRFKNIQSNEGCCTSINSIRSKCYRKQSNWKW